MKTLFRNFYTLACISSVLTVIMDPGSKDDPQEAPPEHLQSEDPRTFNEALRTCFAKRSHGTLECINRGALSTLQAWNDDECLDFGSVKLERSEGQSRNILDLDWDPKDFGNVVKAASRLMERRNMRWDLSGVYPGLQMRVGPTLSAGNGLLEFVVDERTGLYHNRQLGTGRLLIRQLVLPFLLGFKFNVAALLPLLFGFLIVLTKKALLLTKVALFIAGLLGWNSLFGGHNGPSSPGFVANGAYGVHANPTFGQGISGLNPTSFQDPNYPYLPYRGEGDNSFPFGQHVIREIVNVYETSNQENEENNRRNKNFVWTRNEP
ncbi:uncharacterized protein LOC106642527 [Copidosoma floridanum]|uniref:uncharacterized protein LOC106642527 n=1 Tax=Copidosoma floridanum TaxID=29053 RepID=UPI0006C9C496|nr:uncharacterized protein LOC106642527 [Copidosoma floridanum]